MICIVLKSTRLKRLNNFEVKTAHQQVRTTPHTELRKKEVLLVFERGVDLCVAASVKLPHLEGDFVAFGVALGRLIPLV